MNFIKKAFSAMGVLCLTLGVCSVVNATKNNEFKAIFLGDVSSKKTKILNKLAYGDDEIKFNQIDSYVRIEHLGENYNIRLCDTAGQVEYNSLIPQCLRNIDIGFITYKSNDTDSFETAKDFIKLFREYNGHNPIILLENTEGNNPSFDDNYVYDKSKSLGIDFHIRVNPEDGTGIKNIMSVMSDMCKQISDERQDHQGECIGFKIQPNNESPKSRCCK